VEDRARDWFRKLESGDFEAKTIWNRFRELSLTDFKAIYNILRVEFDVMESESEANVAANEIVEELLDKGIATVSRGAVIVDLEEEGLGVAILRKNDGTTIYVSRDLATAVNRYRKYGFHKMIYEVGAEQKIHFQQFFHILKMAGYEWASSCQHVAHGNLFQQYCIPAIYTSSRASCLSRSIVSVQFRMALQCWGRKIPQLSFHLSGQEIPRIFECCNIRLPLV